MECHEVQERLPAYLEGSLSPEERAAIKEHLKPCEKCSQSLADLQKAIAYVRDLPEVEPPAWLAQRVMARVRSEAEARKGIWQILFYPIHIKLPLEAAAAIAIAVSTIYVFKTMEPTMYLSKAPSEGVRAPAISEVQKPAVPQGFMVMEKEGPTPKPAERLPIKGEAKAPARRPAPAPVPKPDQAMPSTEPSPPRAEREEAKAPNLAAQDKAAPAKTDMGVAKVEPERAQVPPAAPPEEVGRLKAAPPPAETLAGAGAREESKHQALSAAPRAKALAEKKEFGLHLTLAVHDMEAATSEIEKAIADLGGKILQEEHQENKTTVVAELSSDQLDALFSKLKPMGEVKGKAADFEAKEGGTEIVRVEIFRIQ